jgi:filamentous hemagglutinin family protein
MIRTAQPAYRAIRKKLLISCASVALATAALAPQKAKAQVAAPEGAFRGSITGTTGTVSREPVSNSTETIHIGSPTATIDWNPTGSLNQDGNLVFLPEGNIATFLGDSNAGNYTVLNRILPDGSVAIQLDGTVLSLVDGNTTGGKIWFYSPNGIVIGSTAVFDVGSLLLTTVDPNSWDVTTGGFTATLGQGQAITDPLSKIQILDGASIKALEQNSYIALIAPRIEQGGNVQVNGSAAYIAGEQMTMSFNQGLFDVAVNVGSGDLNGIVHTGTTGGPANQTAADNHMIYMAAVPKNDAITMLLGGNIGFEPAVSADVRNGQIMLSAGWSPTVGEAGEPEFQSSNTDSNARIDIRGGEFTSDVRALANNEIRAETFDGPLTFDGNIDLWSFNNSVILSAYGGNTLSVGGSASLNATGADSQRQVTLDANGGDIDITGPVFLNAGHSGALDAYSTGTFGGTVNIFANAGGDISTGSININAIATAGDSDVGLAPYAQGGDVHFGADTGGSITVNGTLYADVSGIGGNMLDGATQGGDGTGGLIDFYNFDGQIDIKGDVTLISDGQGGSFAGTGIPGTAQGGKGQGGQVFVWTGGPGTINFEGNVSLSADGRGGSGQTGGSGVGGQAGINGRGGTVLLGGFTSIGAIGSGGNANVGFGGTGGLGQGGNAFIEALATDPNDPEITTDTAATISGGDAFLDVSGYGGAGGAGNGDNIAAGTGGTGQGGAFNGQLGSGGAFAAAQ